MQAAADRLTDLVNAAAADPALLFVAIILATFILEDVAIVAAATLAAGDYIGPAWALAALWIGIGVGDMALYGFGRIGRRVPWVARRLDTENARKLDRVVRKNLVAVVFGARMVPGMRFPTYGGCGLLKVPAGRFAFWTVGATGLWTAGLFTVIWGLGETFWDELGPWRWAAAIVFLGVLLLIERVISRIVKQRLTASFDGRAAAS